MTFFNEYFEPIDIIKNKKNYINQQIWIKCNKELIKKVTIALKNFSMILMIAIFGMKMKALKIMQNLIFINDA
jgi:hypothetical protein